MQFNSYTFILLFLPFFLFAYYLAEKINNRICKYLLIISGAIFYCYGGISSALVLLSSIVINLLVAIGISKTYKHKKAVLIIGIVINIVLLFLYKYYNFTVGAINGVLGIELQMFNFVLPLGISFYTFQQITYLIELFKGEIPEVRADDFLAYILFFPKLIMGPLADPKSIIDQINKTDNKKANFKNIASGLKMFSYGLFKKVIIADTFSKAVAWGFTNLGSTTSGDMFLVMLFYTFQIYFDFSGYSDMAIGVAKMINIDLPCNFDSPYKATSIRDFWKRWHISLTRFFTKYVYFPLGGSRAGNLKTYRNIMIVFLVSGLWHGANWTFILWGGVHGIFQVIERILEKHGHKKLFEPAGWLYTFLSVNLLWLLFRSDSIQQWALSIGKMFSFQDMSVSQGLIDSFILPESSILFDILHLETWDTPVRGLCMILMTVFSLIICIVPENNYINMNKLNYRNMVSCAFVLVWSILCLSSESVFVYFNF